MGNAVGDKNAIGIDIGRESLKCVVVSAQKGAVKVTGSESVRLELAADADASAWRAAAVKALSGLRARKVIPDGPVAVTAPTAHTLIRALKVPTAKLELQLPEEAKQQLPFPLEELDWDAAVVGSEGEQSFVSLAAIKKDINADLLAMLAESGIAAQRIESGALALANLVLHAGGGTCSAPVAVMSLGATAANLTIIDGTKVWMRTLPVTGLAVVSGLAKALGISEAEARETLAAKINLAEQAEQESDAVKNVRATMMRLVMEVTRSLTFYKSQLNGEKPHKLLLTGGYSVIPGVREFLADRLKMPVEALETFGAASGGDTAHAAWYGEALGCALAAAGTVVYKLNLMPKDIVAQRALDRKKPFVLAAAVLVLAVFATLYVLALGNKNALQAEAAGALAQADTAQRFDRQINEIEKTMRIEDSKTENLRRVLWERELYPYVLQQFAAVLPSNVWLYSVDTVTFGEVYDRERLSTSGRGAARMVMIDDPELLARPVRVMVRGGSYGDGAWTEELPEIERKINAVPDFVALRQTALTRYRKYAEFDLEVDLDFDRNGKADSADILEQAASQPAARPR